MTYPQDLTLRKFKNRSFLKNTKRNGTRIEPSGTPILVGPKCPCSKLKGRKV